VKIACHKIDAEFPEGAGLDLNFSLPHFLRPPRGSTQSRTLRGRELVLALLYADDLTALTKSSAVARRVLEILVATCKRFGLYASFKKTFTQVFNDPALAAEPSLFEVAGHTIENVTRFKLLGHTVDTGSTSAFVNARIASATGQYYKFRHVFGDRTINKFSKIRFLEAYVRSRLTYAVAATAPTEEQLSSLAACWYRCLRRLHPFGFARKSNPDGTVGTAFVMSNSALDAYTVAK